MSAFHLGETVSAFVDEELDHDARDRALAHLAHCAQCREEVDAERTVKARLRGLDGPVPPSELVQRLVDLPAVEAAAVPVPTHAPDRPPGRSDRSAPATGAPSRRPRRNRRRVVVGSGGALVIAALGTAFAVGGGPTGGRPVTPEIERFTVEHAAVTEEVPLTDTGTAVTVSFLTPAVP